MITLSQHKDLSHNSRELKVAQRLMSLICGSHELGSSNRNQLDFQYSGIQLPSKKVKIGAISYGTDVSIHIDALGSYSISLPLQGHQQLRSRGACFDSDNMTGLIVSNIEQQELIIAKDCKKIQVVIPEDSVRSVLTQLLSTPVEDTVIFEPQMSLANTQFLQVWWKNVHQCLEFRQHYADLNGLTLLSDDYENFLIKGLLLSQNNNYSDQLKKLTDHQEHRSVRRVKEFIHRFADKELDANDLLMVSGTSKSKLYREFQEDMKMSPMDYLKHYRLEKIHQVLLQKNPNHSISRLALDWGFRHLGRFSQDYRDKYGVLPSETLRK